MEKRYWRGVDLAGGVVAYGVIVFLVFLGHRQLLNWVFYWLIPVKKLLILLPFMGNADAYAVYCQLAMGDDEAPTVKPWESVK